MCGALAAVDSSRAAASRGGVAPTPRLQALAARKEDRVTRDVGATARDRNRREPRPLGQPQDAVAPPHSLAAAPSSCPGFCASPPRARGDAFARRAHLRVTAVVGNEEVALVIDLQRRNLPRPRRASLRARSGPGHAQ